MKLSKRPIAAMCAAACGAVLAAPAIAQDTDTQRWHHIAETRDYAIFIAKDEATGPMNAREATAMLVLKSTGEQGVEAQQTHYVFDCGRDRFTVTGLTFIVGPTRTKVPQPGNDQEQRWRDDQVAKSVGEMACDERVPQLVLVGMEAAFAEARR